MDLQPSARSKDKKSHHTPWSVETLREASGLTVDPTENLFQRKRVPKKMLEDGSTSFGASFLWFFQRKMLKNLSRKETKKDGIRFSEKLVLSVFFSFLTGGDKNDICPKGVSQMWKILNEKSSMTGDRSKKPRSSQKGCTNTNHFAEPPPLRHLEMEWVFCPLVFLVIKKYLGRGLHEHHRVPGPIPPGS